MSLFENASNKGTILTAHVPTSDDGPPSNDAPRWYPPAASPTTGAVAAAIVLAAVVAGLAGGARVTRTGGTLGAVGGFLAGLYGGFGLVMARAREHGRRTATTTPSEGDARHTHRIVVAHSECGWTETCGSEVEAEATVMSHLASCPKVKDQNPGD